MRTFAVILTILGFFLIPLLISTWACLSPMLMILCLLVLLLLQRRPTPTEYLSLYRRRFVPVWPMDWKRR